MSQGEMKKVATTRKPPVVIPVVVKPVIERKLAPWSQTTVARSNKWAEMDSDSEDEEDNSAWEIDCSVDTCSVNM